MKSGKSITKQKIVVLKNFAKFTEKRHCQSVFFNKKNTLVLVFSCEFYKNFKSTFSTEHLRGTMFLSIELLSVL